MYEMSRTRKSGKGLNNMIIKMGGKLGETSANGLATFWP